MRKLAPIALMLLCTIKTVAQVNLQTGSAVFSLPIFNWKDDKSRLNSVVALSYNSGSGLKVNDIASNVGQGWNLVAGGVITRMQVGEPDDQPALGADDGNDQNIKKYPPGYLYSLTPVTQGCPIALTRYPNYSAKNRVYAQHNSTGSDRQLDYFSFQFNGKSGMFVLDAANGVGRTLGDSKIKIAYQQLVVKTTCYLNGTRTTINSFTLQDVDGLTYIFSTLGQSKVLHTQFCKPNGYPQTQPKMSGGNVYYQASHDDGTVCNPWVIDNWYLSEVDDSLTNRKITFNYNLNNINNTAGADFLYYRGSDYVMVNYKTSILQTPDIFSIVYPDGHTVTFNYDLIHPRADLNGEFPLASIDVTYNDGYTTRPLSKHLLNTSYFILNRYGTPLSSYQKSVARLCLKSVQKIGVDLKEDTPPYLFDYFTGSTGDDFVPPPFFYAKDIWGYYNGNSNIGNNNSVIPLNLSVSQLQYQWIKGLCHFYNDAPASLLTAKAGYAQNGLLKQIVYPTGGTLSYQYAQNTGAFDVPTPTGTVQTVGGVHVSQTSSTDGGFSNGCSNPIITQYNYVLSGTSNPSLWGLEMPNNTLPVNSHYFKEQHGFHLLPPKCVWTYQYPGILSLTDKIDLKGWQNLLVSLGPVLDIVGVIGDVVDVINLVCYGSGLLAWAAVVADVINAVIQIITSCSNGSQDNIQNIYYNSNLNDVGPLPTQFKRVEVVESSGAIGKTVYEFTSTDEYALWIPQNTDLVNRQRFAPWAYGLPKRTIVYDANNNPVKLDTNVYSFGANNYNYLTKVDLSLPSYKCTVNKSSSQRSDDWSNPTLYNATANYATSSTSDLAVDGYSMYTGRIVLDTTYQKVFKQNSSSLSDLTTTGYYYNTGNYEVAQSFTLQSNGDAIRKYFNYSNNYSTGVYARLATLNNIGLPVETVTNVYRSGGAAGTITQNVTEYLQQANGDIKPSRLLEKRFSQLGSTSLYDPSGGGSGYTATQAFTYDGNGNLIGLQDEGNHLVTNIYGYNDKYIIASVINADPNLDKCAYTSFEVKNAFGGWTLNGSGTYNTASAITGAQSYTLNAGSTLSASLNTAKSYIVSFWAASTGITVTGGTLVKSAPTYNGFTYYEYSIAQGTSSVSVGGTVAIDELRLYPSNARMRTISYDPLLGKTSESDENNRITYYEYDNVGRLRFVKDETKNALKMYEYNNISAAKQNGCPATYSNHAISEQFSKSCSAGYLADSTTFTVTAGTYTSSLSQADADAQAEMYLLTNGQNNANTNGHCRLLYYNSALSATYPSQTCPEGYAGGTITYTVPYGRYTSIFSQADANQQAADDTAANGQAYANDPNNAVCNVTTAADWSWSAGGQIKCQQVSGSTHEFVLMTDINPNSSTYNQTQWVDVGTPQDACPVTTCSFQWQGGITNTVTSNISSSGGITNFQLVFGAPTNNYSGGVIGQITGGCAPSATRTVLITDGGNSSRQWNMTFSTNGSVSISLYSGPQASMGTNPPIVLSGSFTQ